MTEKDQEPEQTTETTHGSVTYMLDGVLINQYVPIKTTYTFHPDGRKDCCVKVPRISTKARKK